MESAGINDKKPYTKYIDIYYNARHKRMRGSNNGFEPVNLIAERFIDSMPESSRYRDFESVKKIWNDISGDFICSNTALTSLKNNILTITAVATPFLFHLNSYKKTYINQINEKAGRIIVADIFYKIGPLKKEAAQKTMFDELNEYARHNEIIFYEIENIEIPDAVIASINDFTASLNIKDAELAAKITGAAKVIYKVTQYKKRNGFIECAMCASLYEKKDDCRRQAPDSDAENDICQYCGFKLDNMMHGPVKRIIEFPWENYEAHSAVFPEVKFKEFEYIKKKEFIRAKARTDELVRKFILSESMEDFTALDVQIRLAMSLYENRNYFEIKEFGAAGLDSIAAVLGTNARSVFARGSMIIKF